MMDLLDILKLVAVVLDFASLLSNGYALLYICLRFNLRIHVFTLAFVDALATTTGCLVSSSMHVLFLASAVRPGANVIKQYCGILPW